MGKEEDLISGLNEVYGLLCEYTSGEEDEEMIRYNDRLLDTLIDSVYYIRKVQDFKEDLYYMLEREL